MRGIFIQFIAAYFGAGFRLQIRSNRKHAYCASLDLTNDLSEKSFWASKERVVSSEIALIQLGKYEEEYLKLNRTNSQKQEASPPPADVNFNEKKNVSAGASSSGTTTKPRNALGFQSIGLKGNWEESAGNFILRPISGKPPIAVIHFLGGAFAGAAPHLTYRYLLESLCEAGYIIVATPYRLELDYVKSCDGIVSKFDAVAVELASQYGPVPVIGLGHSCGALLQTLITCLFPDTPRALNILISFNNKPVKDAIPGFEEFILPISQEIMSDNYADLRKSITNFRESIKNSIVGYASSPVAPPFLENEVVPFIRQSMEIIDQIPDIFESFSNGIIEFQPSPADTKEVCRRMYRARKTLLIRFENDALDETVEIDKILREANTIMRMKRPMIQMQCQMQTISGTHITPLTQNIILEPPVEVPLVDSVFKPIRSRLRSDYLKTVDEVKDMILNWLQASMSVSS